MEIKEAEVFAEAREEEEDEEKVYTNFDDLRINDKLKEVLKMNSFEKLTNV